MTASRTGLAVLAAIAAALAVVHLVIGEPPLAASRAPFAGTIGDGDHELRWERPGQPPVVIAGGDRGWTMTAPSAGPVDPAVAADVLTALRGARWQRRSRARPAAPRFALQVDRLRLEVGADVPGVGSWLHDGEHAYLVEPWVITAIDRDAVALRVRSPVAAVLDHVRGVVVHGPGLDVELAGTPLELVRGDGRIRLAPEVATALLAKLAALRVEALVGAGALPGEPVVTIRLFDGTTAVVLVRGSCPIGRPELVWIGGSAGEVCVDGEPIASFQLAAQLIVADPLAVADPRPIAAEPIDVTFASGARLHWRGASVEVVAADGATQPADATAVAKVVTALTAPTTLYLLASPRPAAAATITVVTAAGTETLELIGGDTLASATGPLGFRLSRDAVTALRQDASALRERVLWRTEPTLLTGLVVLDPGAAPRTVPIDDPWARAIADAVAEPRAVRFAPAAGVIRRAIELTYAPPPAAGAAPEVHRLELGAAVAGGCVATADGTIAVVAPDLCRLLAR